MAVANLTGYAHNNLAKMNISEFLPAESFKLTIERQRTLLKDETAAQDHGLELIKKDGVRRNVKS